MIENLHENEKVKGFARDLVDRVKEIVRKGNVTKLRVIRGGETVLNLPVTAGVVAWVAAPLWAILLAAITAVGLSCSVDVVKEDGQVIHVV